MVNKTSNYHYEFYGGLDGVVWGVFTYGMMEGGICLHLRYSWQIRFFAVLMASVLLHVVVAW